MRFSERYGYVKVSTVIQTDGMNDRLRNCLWNLAEPCLTADTSWDKNEGNSCQVARAIAQHYLKTRVDELPALVDQAKSWIRTLFLDVQWYQVYDLIELFVLMELVEPDEVNQVLENELSGFRCIDRSIVPVHTQEEVQSIENAINDNDGVPGARQHLKNSLKLLSDRENPDYRNAIKEAISAVEGTASVLSGHSKVELGKALTILEAEKGLHGALKAGFSSLYGYASNAEGIRHAMLDAESNLGQEDAIYFLVTCSAFINYLNAKYGS
jgi:hypothetical protein